MIHAVCVKIYVFPQLQQKEDNEKNTMNMIPYMNDFSHYLSHVKRLWYFSSSVNSFFKRTCAAIQWGYMSNFWVGPFVYFHTSCAQTAMAWRDCTGSLESSLVA